MQHSSLPTPSAQPSPRWMRAGYSSPHEHRQNQRSNYGTNSTLQRSRDYQDSGELMVRRYPTPEAFLELERQRTDAPRLFNLKQQVRLVIAVGWEVDATIKRAYVDREGQWNFETDCTFLRYVHQLDLALWNNSAPTRAVVVAPVRLEWWGITWEGEAARHVEERQRVWRNRLRAKHLSVLVQHRQYGNGTLPLPNVFIGFPPAQ